MTHGGGEIDVALRTVKVHRDPALRFDASELGQEVDVEVRPPVLAVRDTPQPQILLEFDDVADRLVFHGSKLVCGDLTRLELIARVEEKPRTQEAADVIGAKRRRRARADDR